jgi:hypothetical protein
VQPGAGLWGQHKSTASASTAAITPTLSCAPRVESSPTTWCAFHTSPTAAKATAGCSSSRKCFPVSRVSSGRRKYAVLADLYVCWHTLAVGRTRPCSADHGICSGRTVSTKTCGQSTGGLGLVAPTPMAQVSLSLSLSLSLSRSPLLISLTHGWVECSRVAWRA